MASKTLTGWTNKFLQKINTLTSQDKTDARTLIDAASHTDTVASLAAKQPLDADLTAYADAADAAARRALINAASDDSPDFNSPTALTATVGDRSSLIATTEFVWGNGPLKAIPASGNNAGSLLAQYNTTTAANTLGYGAVDLQSSRAVGSQTATGQYSFIAGGANNTTSGVASFSCGATNTSSGTHSFTCGTQNTASGSESFACGGGHSVTGSNGFASGGSNTVSASWASAFGRYSTASLRGQIATGAASSNTQRSQFDLYKQTTDATPAILAIDGSSAKLTIRSDWSMAGTINILGIKTTDGTVAAHYIRKFAIKNVAGTTSLTGTVTALGTDYESDAGLDVAVTANNTDDSLDITVTGLAATTIRWAAVVDAVELKLT